MNRRFPITVVAVALVCVVGLGWIVVSHKGTARDLRLRTISILNRTYVGIVLLEDKYKSPIVDIIKSRDAHQVLGLNRSLALLFEEDDVYIAEKAKPLSPLQLLDDYGNALICVPREEVTKRSLPEGLLGKKRSVIVYSVGPNGKDEGGRGDDVFWEEP